MRNRHASTFGLGLEVPFSQQVTLAEGVRTRDGLKECRSCQAMPAHRSTEDSAPNVPPQQKPNPAFAARAGLDSPLSDRFVRLVRRQLDPGNRRCGRDKKSPEERI